MVKDEKIDADCKKKNNQSFYLSTPCERAGKLVLKAYVHQGRNGIFVLVFEERGKTEISEKSPFRASPRTRNKNKLNQHEPSGPGIEPRPQRWDASALITEPSLLPNLKSIG